MRPRLIAAFALLALAIALAPAADDRPPPPPPGLVATLKGHQEPVYGVAFSPDGQFLLTAAGDPVVKVWQLPSGKEMKSFGGPDGHKGIILGVAVSPDGSQFATVGADNSARLWDFPTSKNLRAFPLPAGAQPRSVASTADGTKFAGGDSTGKIRIWAMPDAKQLQEIAAHAGPVTGLSFSPNGLILASVGADSTLRYWNVADGKPLGAIGAHASEVNGVAYSVTNNLVFTTGTDGTLRFWTLPPVPAKVVQGPFKDAISALTMTADGTTVATASGKDVRLITLANAAVTKEFVAPEPVTCVSVTPAFVAAGAGQKLLVWQTKDNKLVTDLGAHAGAVTGAAFSPGGTQVATVGKDGALRVWNIPPTPTRKLVNAAAVRSAVVSPDGKRIAVAGVDRFVRLYKLDALQTPERQFAGHATAVSAIALSTDNKSAASAGDDETIRFWDLAKGDQTAVLGAHTGPIASLVYTGGDTQVLSAGSDGAKLWQVPAASSKGLFTHAGGVTSAVLTPDGTKLLTGCVDKQVRLWNLATGQVERAWTGPTLAVSCVAVNSNATRVAAGGVDKSVYVWEAGAAKVVQKLALPAAVQTVGFAADGKHILSGLADGSVRIHDLTNGKEVGVLEGHKGAVNGLVFSAKGEAVFGGAEGDIHVRTLDPKAKATVLKHGVAINSLTSTRDGKQLAVASDKVVKLYALADGKLEGTITAPAAVRGLAYSSDGKRLALACADGKARVLTATGLLEEYLSHEGPVNAVVFALDGRRLFTASDDKTARNSPLALTLHLDHGGAVRQALVNPQATRLQTIGADGMLKLWNRPDGKLIQAIRAHAGAIAGMGIANDGRIVTAGADKKVRVWDPTKMVPGKTGGKDLDAPVVEATLPGDPLSVSLTSDGKRAAIGVSVAGKERVVLLDAGTGKVLITLGETEPLPAGVVSFQADGRTLLLAGADKSAQLMDTSLASAVEAHPGGAMGVTYHSNGTQVLTAGGKTVQLWTLATNKSERTFGPLAADVTSFGFSRDFTQVAATAGKVLKVWTLADGKEVASVDLPTEVTSLSFNQDKTRIALAGKDGRARVFDVVLKKEVQSALHAGPVTGVAFHPFQPQLVSVSADKTVAINTLTLGRLIVVGGTPNALAVSTNGQHVVTAASDGKAKVWNIGNGVLERTCEAGDKAATSVAVSRNNTLIAVGSADNKVRLFGFADAKIVTTISATAEPKTLAFTPNSQGLVAGDADGNLIGWNTTFQPGQPMTADFGNVLQKYTHAKAVSDVTFAGTGPVFYSAAPDGAFKAWKLASDGPTKSFTQPASVNAGVFDKTGTLLATGCSDGRVRLYDTAKGTLAREIVAHNTPNVTSIYGVAFSPDGKEVASCGQDQTIKVWNVADGKLLKELKAYADKTFPKGHRDAVQAVVFSPDGKQLASGAQDGAIKIWNLADASVIKDLVNADLKAVPGEPAPAHPGWVYGLAWTKDKKIVSVGKAPQLRGYLATWSVETGKMLSGREIGMGSIYGLALSPDEKFLAIATGGTVRTGPELNLGVVLKLAEK